ncbi:kinase-like domain-containing protein [Mycena albidolilacea]|uniref:Kinase-like domain-containing protein n=1 Tax=Mycena albidolilacea TaxID=1033008 RepID=A0AAD6Z3N6_9AGAR|nr:kinase-like domain-containing protein [Mycena albidolilacea]
MYVSFLIVVFDSDVRQLLDSSAAPPPNLSKALERLSRASGLHPRCFSLSGVEKVGAQVAAGGFSDIWKGLIRGQIVSIKMVRIFQDSDVEAVLRIKDFGREALIWRQLSHPNLLPFFGLYYLEGGLCLVSPWMENGHLIQFLKNASPDTDRLSLILDVAMGLEYLHTVKLVHGDLKAVNILVTHSGRACIADFGLTVIADAVSLSRPDLATCETVRYQAPEVLEGGRNHFASDIYAFACVCYEVCRPSSQSRVPSDIIQILTGKAPFFEVETDGQVILHVHRGGQLSRPDLATCDPILWVLIRDCLQQNPTLRPVAHQITRRLLEPPIQAKAKESITDWDQTSTRKIRRLVQNPPVLPSILEIQRRIFGDSALQMDIRFSDSTIGFVRGG